MTMADFAGTDRFRIIRPLGAGGMGKVYEAEDRERGQRVALKTLKNSTPEALYRIKSESRALAELSHPNLVGRYDLFAGQASCFFTMELIEGEDFLKHVRPGTAQAPKLEYEGTTLDAVQHEGGGGAATLPWAKTLDAVSRPPQYDEERL